MADAKLEVKLTKNIDTLTTLINDYWGNKYFKLYYTAEKKPIILMNKIKHSLLPSNIKTQDINDKILSHILHTDYIGSQMLEQINICYNDANNSWNKFVEIMQFATDYNKKYNNNKFRFKKFETYELLLDDDNKSINKEQIILLLKNISYNFQLLGIFILKYYKEIIINEQRKLDNILKTIKEYFTNINDFYTDDRSINCIYFIIFNLINYRKILIKYNNCDSITKCNKYSLSSAKSIFSDIYKLTSKIFSGKLFSVFFYLINKNSNDKDKRIIDKNFVKKHRKLSKQPFNIYPLNTLFEIIYNIHYTSKYIYNQYRSNAIKLKNIIPDSNKIFLKILKSKFIDYDTILEMGFKNDFGFLKLPSIKNSHIYSDFELKKLNFGQNEIKALKKLYNPKTNNNLYFQNKMFNKAKKIFYKKINNHEKLLNHEIYTRVTSNYSKSLFNSKKKESIIRSLKNMKSININNFEYNILRSNTNKNSQGITY
tara:strand:+ start:17930 stop:19381 length:1452 start_codon:yes stop_codon:yes gene_type:complete